MQRIIYLIVCMMLVGLAPAQAQDSKVGEALEEGLGKAVQGLFGKKKKKEDEPTEATETEEDAAPSSERDAASEEEQRKAMAMMQAMFGSGNDVSIEEVYTFKGAVDGIMVSTDKKGKESKSDITSYFNHEADYFAIIPKDEKNGNTGFVIFDKPNKAMVTLVEENKAAMVIPMDWEASVDEAAEEEAAEGTIDWVKTGNSKTIAGYKAEEYKGAKDEHTINLWIAPDASLSGMGLFGGLFRMSNKNKSTQDLFGGIPDGMIMEAHSANSETGEKSHWTVTKVDLNHSSEISTAGYQVMSLGNMGSMMQQQMEQQPGKTAPKNETEEDEDEYEDEY